MIEQIRRGTGLRTIGWWTPQRDQVDPTIPYLPLEDPAGGSGVTGTGILLTAASTLDAVGLSISTGTGAIISQVSTVLGTGLSASTGTGILLAQTPLLAGIGLSISLGVGILVAAVASLLGTGLAEDAAGAYDWRNRRHRRQVYLMKRKKR